MKKPLMLLVWLCAVQSVLAQPLQRKAERNNDAFTLEYHLVTDSLKGFFMVSEHFNGKVKLLQATCKVPYKFENGHLQLSGDKVSKDFAARFTFQLLESVTTITGLFQAENFGADMLETKLEDIRLEKPAALLASNPPPTTQHKQSTINNEQTTTSNLKPQISNDPPPANNKEQSTINNEPSTTPNLQLQTSNDPPLTINNEQSTINISFRIQLAASTTPMDKQRISQLTGLDLPVYEDKIDGYYKYTIGNEADLKNAQLMLNRLAKDHFKKPFIVAYRQKDRITVQQALAEINRHR